MQGILGLKASMGGFVVTPSSVMWIFASLWAGQLLVKHAPRTILTGSLCILLVGSFILALVPQTTPFWFFLLVAAGLGIGFGLIITTTTVTAQSVAGADKVGVATSFNTLSRTLGQTLMVSVYGIILNRQLAKGIAGDGRLDQNMLNELINPETALNLPKQLLPTLRHILYNGLHFIYFASIVLIAIAIIINLMDRKRSK
ncbi:MAG: MFS transporter, partial [Bacillota bacterium]|nr:MFS transporter [Bacillota bacterium]